jgi:hypothetical protein
VVGVVAASLALTGCGVACAGAAAEAPHVVVDAAAWLQVHPGGRVEACYSGKCESAVSPESLTLYLLGSAPPNKPRPLTVTLTTGGITTDATVTVKLLRVPAPSGPCSFPDSWSRRVLIQADGTLQIGGTGDSSRIIVPTITPTER